MDLLYMQSKYLSFLPHPKLSQVRSVSKALYFLGNNETLYNVY